MVATYEEMSSKEKELVDLMSLQCEKQQQLENGKALKRDLEIINAKIEKLRVELGL